VSGVHLFVEPQAKGAPVLAAIRGATRSIWIEMYLLTNCDVIYALEDAAHRGVETRVLLEMTPYGGSDVSPHLLSEKLTAAGVTVRPSNPAFTFTHAKTLLVDGSAAYIMTFDTPPHTCGRCSGYARPNAPRWRLTGLPGPTRTASAWQTQKALFLHKQTNTERDMGHSSPLQCRGFLASLL